MVCSSKINNAMNVECFFLSETKLVLVKQPVLINEIYQSVLHTQSYIKMISGAGFNNPLCLVASCGISRRFSPFNHKRFLRWATVCPGFFFFFTRGQFWPSGIVVACVCVSVSLCVNHLLVRAITHQPFKLGSLNVDHRCKRPWLRSILFSGVIDLDLQGQI